jgi:Acetyltransferase (GNAT) domain
VSGFEVRDAGEADAPGIRRLFEKVFGSALSEEEWRWKFAQDPDGWYGVVGVAGGEIVGHYAGWGTGFILDGEPRLLYSVGDVATDPTVRGLGGRRGVYRAMVDAFYESVRRNGVPICYGFPNARARAISEKIAGTRTFFEVRLVQTDVEAFSAPPPDAGAGEFVDESFDPLWEAARRAATHAPVRDRARVNWRFHARPTRYYRMVWRKQGSEMLGWAALSAVSDGTSTIVDYVGREADGRDLPPLFAAAAAEARALGARHLAFWESPGGPGRAPIAALPGERRDAGFPMDARVFDEDAGRRFAASVSFVPSLYDLV